VKFAAREEALRKIQIADNLQIPLLDRKPEIWPDLVWIWEFFLKLCMTRPNNGYSLLPISFQEVQALASLEGIWYYEDIEDLLFFIPQLDAEYIRLQEEKTAASTKKSSASKGVRSK
jgi:hypothetical protein